MKAWLTPRCVGVMLLLVAAPGAALGQAMLSWLPGTVAAARLNGRIEQQVCQIDEEWTQLEQLRRERLLLEERVSVSNDLAWSGKYL